MSRDFQKRFWTSLVWNLTLLAMLLNMLFPAFDMLRLARAQETTPEPSPTEEVTPVVTDVPPVEVTAEVTAEVTTEATVEATPVPTEEVTAVVTDAPEVTELPLPTLPPPTAEVSLFVDNFQDGGASLVSNGWSLSGGWSIASEVNSDGTGNYYLSAAPTGTIETAAVPQIQWDNLTLAARVRVGGSDAAGISVRSGAEAYTVVINGSGLVQLYRGTLIVAEGPAVAAETIVPDAEGNVPPAAPAVWRTVNIEVQDATLVVLLDGVEQIRYTDEAPLGAGAIGLVAHELNAGTVDFDDIYVTRLLPPVVPTEAAPVEVTSEATAEATTLPAGVLLDEHFEGDLSAWTSSSLDLGTVDAGEGNHVVLMPSGADLTPASVLVLGDFRLDARFSLVTAENGGVQITLRDAYTLTIDTTQTTLARGETVLSSSTTPHGVGIWYNLSVTLERDHIVVNVNGLTEIDLTDPEPTLAGGIGFVALGAVMLDDVVVTDLTSQAVLAEVTPSPTPLAIDDAAQAKLDGALYYILTTSLSGDDAAYRAAAASYAVFVDDAGRLRVRIYTTNGVDGETLRSVIEGTGGVIERMIAGEIIALVPPLGIVALAGTPEVAGIGFPDAPVSTDYSQSDAQSVGSVVPQSLDIVGSNDWDIAGIRGANIDIAVIDSPSGGFLGSTPGGGTGGGNQQCLYSVEAGSGGTHGTNVVDVLCDIAPNSRVYGFIAADAAGLTTDINTIRSSTTVAGVAGNTFDIILITLDLGVNSSAGDGTGVGLTTGNFYAEITAARNAGILVIAAAGNNGDGTINAGDNYVRYGSFTLGNTQSANVNITTVAGSRVNINWSAWSTTADITASLTGSGAKPLRTNHGNIPGYSFTAAAGAQTLSVTNNSGGALTIQVQVTGSGSNITAVSGAVAAFATTAGTLARPADSPDVLAVGAVCANQTMRYPRLADSSVGPAFDAGGVIPAALPTSGSAIKPDVVAPSHVSTSLLAASNCNTPVTVGAANIADPYTIANNGFNGTSAAAAHVAGMAALLRSNTINNSMNTRVGPGLQNAPAELERYIQTHTIDLYNATIAAGENPPAGTPDGWDRTFGAGLTMLGSPTVDMSAVQNFGNATSHDANTFYVGQANLASTQVGTSADPYLSIAQAVAANPGKRIVVMPGEYVSGINVGVAGTSIISYDSADIVNRPDTSIWVNDTFFNVTAYGGAAAGINVNDVDNVTIDGFVFNSAHPLYIDVGPASRWLPPRAVNANAVAGLTLANNTFNNFTASVSLTIDGTTNVTGNTFNSFTLPAGSGFETAVLAVMGRIGSGGTSAVNITRNVFSNNSNLGGPADDNRPREAVVYMSYGSFNFYSNRLYSNTAEAMVSINQWEEVLNPSNTNRSTAEVRIFSSAFTNNTIVNSDARSIVNLYQGSQFRFVNNTVANTDFSLGNRGSFITIGGVGSPANHFDGTSGSQYFHEWEIHNNLFYGNLFAGGGSSRNLITFTNGAINLGCFNIGNPGTDGQGAHNNWFIYTDYSSTVPTEPDNKNRPDQGLCGTAVNTPANNNIFTEITSTTDKTTFEGINFFGAATDPIDPYRLRPTSTIGVDGANDTYVTAAFTGVLDALGLTRTVNRIGAGAPDTDLGAYELSDPQPLVVSGPQTINSNEDPANGYIVFALGSGVVTGGVLPLRYTLNSQPSNFNASATSPCSGVPVQYDAASNQAAYCPPPDFYTYPAGGGIVTFNYTVTDALGEASATGTVNINLSAVNDGNDSGTFGTVGSPQVVFTDVLTPTNYRLRPYADFNNFRLSDPTTERGQDYPFTFSNATFVSGSPTLLGVDQTATVAALNAALTGANSNGGYLVVNPIPGNTGELIFSYTVTDGFSDAFAGSGFVRVIVTQRLAGIGLHDDVSLDFVFSSGWAPLYSETANNNSLHYTNTLDDQIDFYFSGDTFIITLLGLASGGNIEVMIDPDGDNGQGFQTPQALGLTCTSEVNAATGIISSLRTTTAFFSAGCRGLDTSFASNVHILRIKHKSAGLLTIIDSIEIRGSTLSGGYYEERDFSLNYTGTWSDFVFTGPKGGSARWTSTLGSSITFQYNAAESDGIILYHPLIPGWGTMRVCASGGGCYNVNQNSATLRWGYRTWIHDTDLNIGGSTGIHTITITPTIGGAAVGLEAIYIHSQPNALGAPISVSPTAYEDNNAALRYIGTWSFFSAAQMFGGSAQSTTDPSASVMFNIDSSAYGIAVYRTTGTGTSNMEICVDDTCQTFNSAGPTLYGDTAVLRLGSPGPHMVEIRNTAATFMNVEAIRVLGAAGPLSLNYYEETETAADFNLAYSGTWSNFVGSAFVGGTARYTSSTAASITFQIDASVVKRIGIYRTQFVGASNFSVCASGSISCATVINNTGPTALGRLAVLSTTADLGISDSLIHTITIRTTTPGALGIIEAIELRGIQGALAPGYYEETQLGTSLNLLYSGTWTDGALSGPRGGTYRYATSTSSNISFTYDPATSNGIVVYYPTFSTAGTLRVCNGANCTNIVETSSTVLWGQRQWITPANLGDPVSPVTITLTPLSSGPIAAIEAIYVHSTNNGLGTLSASTTPYEETDSALRYIGTWTPLTNGSTQGGTSRYTLDPSGAIMFNIDSSAYGVALYRTAGSTYGSVEICIDATCQTYGPRSTATIYSDIVSSRSTVGPHLVEIRNTGATTLNVEGIRVLSATTPLGIGYYEDRESTANFNMTYSGNWNFINTTGLAGGDAHTTSSTVPALTFDIDTAVVKRIVIYRMTGPSGIGNLNVSATTGTFPVNNTTPALAYNSPQIITLANLSLPSSGVFTITVRAAANAFVDIEAIQLVGAAGVLTPGYYDATESGANFNLNFGGTWTNVVAAGPRGATDRIATTTTSEATFTYDSANADGLIVYYTKGAGRGSLQVCADTCSNAGVPIDQSSATTLYAQRVWITEAALGIADGSTHTIRLRPQTNGLPVGLDALYVHGNNSIGASLAVNGTPYQETNVALRYIGTWASFALAQVNGGTAIFSTDPGGAIMFNIDGSAAGVALYRTITSAGGPTEVCIDSTCQTFAGAGASIFGDTAALLRVATTAGQHFVEIRSTSSAQTIVEAIQVVSAVTPLAIGYYEETEQATAFNLSYQGTWTTWSGGLLGGTGRYTTTFGSTMTFRVDPSAMDRIVIFHSMGSGWGTFNVCSEQVGAFGNVCVPVNTNSATTRYGVAAIISKSALGIVGSPTPHTITVQPTSSAFISIEALQILGVPGPMGVGYYEETGIATSFNLTFTGPWTDLVTPLVLGGTARYATSPTAEARFTIDSAVVTRLALFRTTGPGWGDLEVCHGSGSPCVTVPNSGSAVTYGVPFLLNTSALGAGQFEVVVRGVINGVGVDIEALQLLGAAAPLGPGYYEETEASSNFALQYTSTGWTKLNAVGPRGGSMRYASTTASTITFDYNPTTSSGIMIYHPGGSAWGTMQICNGATCVPINESTGTPWNNRTWVTNANLGSPVSTVTITIRPASNGPLVGIDAIYIHGSSSIGTPLATSTTPYEETDPAFRYIGTWTSQSYSGFFGGTARYSMDPGASVMFNVDASAYGVALYRSSAAGWSTLDICVDASCQSFTPTATQTYSDIVFYRTTVGPHVVEIKNTGAATNLYIEAIKVLGQEAPLSPGFYQENDPNMIYTGTWSTLNSSAFQGGAARTTVEANSTLSFKISGGATGFSVFVTRYAGGPDIEICYTRQNPLGTPVCTTEHTNNAATQLTFGFATYGLNEKQAPPNQANDQTYNVTVRHAGTNGQWLGVEAIAVFGTPSTTLTAGTYDDMNPGIVYGPAPLWLSGTSSIFLSGTWHYGLYAGTIVQVRFTGNSITVFQAASASYTGNVNACLVVPVATGNQLECANFSQAAAATTYGTPITVYGFGFGTHDIVLETTANAPFSVDTIQVR